jgi:hypothetical protein
MPVVDLADVQGFILRGYTMPAARYLGLTVREPRAARALLGTLITGDTAAVSVTTAQPWQAKPQCCVNLGITFPGLAALGVPPVSLDSFPADTRKARWSAPPGSAMSVPAARNCGWPIPRCTCW